VTEQQDGQLEVSGGWRALRRMHRAQGKGRGFWFGLAIEIGAPIVMTFTKPVWRGGDRLPASGPALLASNHVSFVDPVTMTAFVIGHGRIPRFLAKAELWRIPLIGRVLAGGGHIPVHRDTRDAKGAYRDAVAALERGEVLVVYPESTFTNDPDGWPMRGRTGIARMALAAGVPVLPVAQWGGQRVLPPKHWLPRLLPRKRVTIQVGPPVDLSEFEGVEPTRAVLVEATAKIMAAITELLVEIRATHP
jgi:1-acyl-sn-glycerol-3-phosphate acyltransferase